MKKHWKLLLIVGVLGMVVALIAALSVGTAAASGDKALTLMAGGNTSGTWFLNLTQHPDGSISTATVKNVSTQSTHGGYLSPNGTLYVDTFLPGPGGQYGLLEYKKDALGNWNQTGFDVAQLSASGAITNAGALVDGAAGTGNTVSGALAPVASAAGAAPAQAVPVGMYCSTKLMDNAQDPNKGILEVGDIATGLNYFFNMTTKSWTAILGSTGTVCDVSFKDDNTGADPEMWSSGHTNNILHFTQSQNAKYGVEPVLDPQGSDMAAAKLAHTSRIFNLGGTEYLVWSDGSAGDLVFKTTKDNKAAGRFHVVNGENHAVALNMADGYSDGGAGYINGVVPNFATGGLTGIQINLKNGAINVDVKNVVNGTNTNADICNLDIVASDGAWRRN